MEKYAVNCLAYLGKALPYAPKPERCLNQTKMPANTKVFADVFLELLARGVRSEATE